ncbi:uncharacterized protein [Arachis hypogaea]|uniref:uncharacterized protein isoform X2 n=1 Tax=Arachis hypogaea TaxID=3818 RepID=UPI003B210C3C
MLAERPAAEYLNRKILEGKTIAEKLDSLIELTFLHLESCQSSGQLSEFVVFYACALDPEDCGEKFAMVLVHFFLFPFFHSCAISCFWFLWSTQNVQILLGRLLMDVLKYQLVQFASRLDPDRSGILTTLCDHSFQCPYVSKWTYLSCQYYESLLAEAQSKVDRSVSEVVEKAVTSGLQDIKDKLENCT